MQTENAGVAVVCRNSHVGQQTRVQSHQRVCMADCSPSPAGGEPSAELARSCLSEGDHVGDAPPM